MSQCSPLQCLQGRDGARGGRFGQKRSKWAPLQWVQGLAGRRILGRAGGMTGGFGWWAQPARLTAGAGAVEVGSLDGDPIWAKVVNAASNSGRGGRTPLVKVNCVIAEAAGDPSREVTSQSGSNELRRTRYSLHEGNKPLVLSNKGSEVTKIH